MEERSADLAIEPEDEPTTDDEVFYNTAMVTNRDLSVACLDAVAEDGWRACDALAASGVRGIRYRKEVDALGEVLVNDIDADAVASIEENAERSGVADELAVRHGDANALLTDEFRSLDYVDVDPFGSPAPYLDSAARALGHETAAGITATDLAVLSGAYPEICRRRYAARSIKPAFAHEVGLRILLAAVFHAFSRYDHAFTPRMAWYERHYYRVFGTVEESKKQCNRKLDEVGFLEHCRACGWRGYRDLPRHDCSNCGAETDVAGPLWTGRFADPGFAADVRDAVAERGWTEAAALAGAVADEAGVRVPYYSTHEIASVADVPVPQRAALLEELRADGYRAVETHFDPRGVRTDTPIGRLHRAFEEDL